MASVEKMRNSKVKINMGNIESDESFKELTDSLDELYESKQKFNLLIETIDVENISLKYLYKFGKYLNSLKRRECLLEFTVIRVYDNYNYGLLYTLFTFLASPVAKVTVIYYEGGYNKEINIQNRNIIKMKDYFPGK